MENNFDYLINKINNIEINNNSNSEIIKKTLEIIVSEYKIDNSIIIKFKDLHNINQNFFNIHSKKNIKFKDNLFCIFCQDKIKSKEHKIYLDKCSHCFHKKCLNTHLKIIKINFKCPICKISYKKSFCDIIKKNIKM